MIVPATKANIKKAAEILRSGGLVAFPTETVYGLGADATNCEAVKKIFAVKNRPAFDPLIVHTHSYEEIWKICDLENNQLLEQKLSRIKKFWPGPLSVVLPKGPHVNPVVCANLETVAVRIPSHPVALSLIRESSLWIAAPSANTFSYVSPTSAGHVEEALGDKIDLVLDGGLSDVGIESTVLSLSGDVPTVLRPGAVTLEMLSAELGFVVAGPASSSSDPESPGMLEKHYAPKTPTILYENLSTVPDGKKVGLITFSRCSGNKQALFDKVLVLSISSDYREIAAKLYTALREFDKCGLDLIVIDSCGEENLGFAIMNRVKKACSKNIDWGSL